MNAGEQEPTGISIHTGFPNPAADNSLHGLDLNHFLIRHSASTYFFRIRGGDWESSGVFDGDIAIIDRALDPRKTDVVIWWNDNSEQFTISTCKDMPKNAQLWGVITSTIHQLRASGQELQARSKQHER